MFGNTNSFFTTLERFGIEVSFVDATDVSNVAAAVKDNTRIVFVETIANPATQVADLEAIGKPAHLLHPVCGGQHNDLAASLSPALSEREFIH